MSDRLNEKFRIINTLTGEDIFAPEKEVPAGEDRRSEFDDLGDFDDEGGFDDLPDFDAADADLDIDPASSFDDHETQPFDDDESNYDDLFASIGGDKPMGGDMDFLSGFDDMEFETDQSEGDGSGDDLELDFGSTGNDEGLDDEGLDDEGLDDEGLDDEGLDDEGLDDEGLDDGEDPDFQGNIRTVRGAALVYKRQQEDNTFEELWIYNVGKDIEKETKIRRAILAGTDVRPDKLHSAEGNQRAETVSMGNVQYLKISGLPN